MRRNLLEEKTSNDIDEIDEIDVSNLNKREIENEIELLNFELTTIENLIKKFLKTFELRKRSISKRN